MSTKEFGEWLRQAREARGLTVEAIASQTKIPPRHLEALERGDTLALPVFYRRAEVRAFARAVGVDEQLALARLEAELAPAEPPPLAPVTPASVSFTPARVRFKPTGVRSQVVLAIIGMGVLVAGLAGWGSLQRTAASEAAGKMPEPDTARPAEPLPSEVPGVSTAATVAASAAAPITPVGPTELVIRTQPEGARVTVDGIGWGTSPVTIRHAEPGQKRVRVTMDGYTATERSVTVDQGSRETIRIRLSSVRPGR